MEDAKAQLHNHQEYTLKLLSMQALESQRKILTSSLADLEKKEAKIAVEKRVMADKLAETIEKLADLGKSHAKVAVEIEEARLGLSNLDSDLADLSD